MHVQTGNFGILKKLYFLSLAKQVSDFGSAIFAEKVRIDTPATS